FLDALKAMKLSSPILCRAKDRPEQAVVIMENLRPSGRRFVVIVVALLRLDAGGGEDFGPKRDLAFELFGQPFGGGLALGHRRGAQFGKARAHRLVGQRELERLGEALDDGRVGAGRSIEPVADADSEVEAAFISGRYVWQEPDA